MHFDHVGNLALFPSATFSIAREEYEFWTGPLGQRDVMTTIVDPEDVRTIQRFGQQGRLLLIDSSEEILPGVVATRLGGHAPVELMLEVSADGGQIVLASDSAHYYEAFELDRPIKLFDDIGDMYRSYEALRELSSRPGTTVIPGYDPRVAELFRMIEPNCIDLTRAPPTKNQSRASARILCRSTAARRFGGRAERRTGPAPAGQPR